MSDLRNKTDEELPAVLSTLGFSQSFTLVDLKLGLGVATVAIAGFLFYVEKKLSFNEAYYIIAGSLVLYFLVSAVLWYFTNAPGYKNLKYVGVNGSQEIRVYTNSPKLDPVYEVKVVIDQRQASPVEGKIPFTKLFDGFGYFNHDAAVEQLRSFIEKKVQ